LRSEQSKKEIASDKEESKHNESQDQIVARDKNASPSRMQLYQFNRVEKSPSIEYEEL